MNANANATPGTPENGGASPANLAAALKRIEPRLHERVLGQDLPARQLLTAFFAGGHALLIGVPGLAKTLMIRTLAEILDLAHARIQFTPDLMPSDITGTSIIAQDAQTGRRHFDFRPGPIFTNLLLADEINRTPPKTQAALLEAMEEHQVTVSGKRHVLPHPFFVLATQNPIEQEGTYPLPITQLDRFLFQIDLDYPEPDTELEIVARTTAELGPSKGPELSQAEVLSLLELPSKVSVPPRLIERATRLVRATRPDQEESTAAARELLSWGAGPRAIQAIIAGARSRALIEGRDAITDADVDAVLLPSLRHRIVLNYHAEAENIRPDDVIARIRRELGDASPPPPPPAATQGAARRVGQFLRSLASPAPAFKKRPE